MRQVNIHEAKTKLSRLIQEAIDGEEIIIARGNKPVVRLEVLPGVQRQRRIGELKHLFESIDDAFNGPLQDFEDYMK